MSWIADTLANADHEQVATDMLHAIVEMVDKAGPDGALTKDQVYAIDTGLAIAQVHATLAVADAVRRGRRGRGPGQDPG